eukprot:TRINITY_DN1062_c0_g1_i1.p1 TRINITY_DN1062_c0_g1~~TRINITY_DN1062_c0_g1_i1.p1  ORF type:complete len:527 (-),score=52.01 TRINITY_DN1062_c0_g1_i1:1257-2837(-)
MSPLPASIAVSATCRSDSDASCPSFDACKLSPCNGRRASSCTNVCKPALFPSALEIPCSSDFCFPVTSDGSPVGHDAENLSLRDNNSSSSNSDVGPFSRECTRSYNSTESERLRRDDDDCCRSSDSCRSGSPSTPNGHMFNFSHGSCGIDSSINQSRIASDLSSTPSSPSSYVSMDSPRSILPAPPLPPLFSSSSLRAPINGLSTKEAVGPKVGERCQEPLAHVLKSMSHQPLDLPLALNPAPAPLLAVDALPECSSISSSGQIPEPSLVTDLSTDAQMNKKDAASMGSSDLPDWASLVKSLATPLASETKGQSTLITHRASSSMRVRMDGDGKLQTKVLRSLPSTRRRGSHGSSSSLDSVEFSSPEPSPGDRPHTGFAANRSDTPIDTLSSNTSKLQRRIANLRMVSLADVAIDVDEILMQSLPVAPLASFPLDSTFAPGAIDGSYRALPPLGSHASPPHHRLGRRRSLTKPLLRSRQSVRRERRVSWGGVEVRLLPAKDTPLQHNRAISSDAIPADVSFRFQAL